MSGHGPRLSCRLSPVTERVGNGEWDWVASSCRKDSVSWPWYMNGGNGDKDLARASSRKIPVLSLVTYIGCLLQMSFNVAFCLDRAAL